MAAYRIKGLGWFAGSVSVALIGYLVTSTVASERAKLASVDNAILQARKDILGLQTEYETRANLPQVEHWSTELALQAPQAQQLVAGETALASLDSTMKVSPIPAVATPASAPVAATPAVVETADAAPSVEKLRKAADPVAAAGTISQARVAMLDRKLLSDSTLTDLMRSARSEAATLR